ncbi:MAG: hypothetical protein IJ184_04480 [Alphaproteobacteria bacterium]|nr:hypothetical protein [Alphaproteobacteria bacterium]
MKLTKLTKEQELELIKNNFTASDYFGYHALSDAGEVLLMRKGRASLVTEYIGIYDLNREAQGALLEREDFREYFDKSLEGHFVYAANMVTEMEKFPMIICLISC